MVSVAVGTLVAASELDARQIVTSDEDQVKLMPVNRTRVSPGDSVLRFRVEEGVSDAQLMMIL